MIIHKLSLPFGTAVPNYYWVKSGTPRILVRIEQFFYDSSINLYSDIWSCGCIMGEFLQGKPLFPGKTEQEQVKLIFKVSFSFNFKVKIFIFRNLVPLMIKSGLVFLICHMLRKFNGNVTLIICSANDIKMILPKLDMI